MLNLSISNWIDLGAAIATIFGVGAAFYTNHQSLKKSQKLTLLQDRTRLFLEAEEFRQAIEDKEDSIAAEPAIKNPIRFHYMINTPSLYYLAKLIPDPLDIRGPSPLDDKEAQKEFLVKKSGVMQDAQMCEFLFDPPENNVIATFLREYMNLLDGRRHYDIFSKDATKAIDDYNRRHVKEKLTNDVYLNQYTNEKEISKKYLEEPASNLRKGFDEYLKICRKLQKQIKV
ncbi:hypothetical protein FCF24_12955 [Lacticaseibacillus paracasei]|uniref:hypothetical protein n=1 Tax=Lacticaseibacillus paracasei TaxID=1597 RepID=UPI0010ADC4A0|nr:hypothetical protein [Lacticaseibacillus paracasei]TJY19356.1 hypothetical protein FCF24_12955 [Lacticaseibacillus paracasei]